MTEPPSREWKAAWAALPGDYPSHVVRVGAVAELDEMLASGRLVDEMAIPPPRPATSAGGTGASDTVPRIKLKVESIAERPKTGDSNTETAESAKGRRSSQGRCPRADPSSGNSRCAVRTRLGEQASYSPRSVDSPTRLEAIPQGR